MPLEHFWDIPMMVRKIDSFTYNRKSGVYMVLHDEDDWKCIFVGQADNLGETLNNLRNHPSWDCIKKHEPTHIATYVSDHTKLVDQDIVKRLNRIYKPLCVPR